MTHPAPPPPPPDANTPPPLTVPNLRAAGVGPYLGDEVRAVLRARLRVLAPLLLSVLVFYFFRNLNVADDLPMSRAGLLLQVILLAMITAAAAPLYGGPLLSLQGLRALELLLFGLAATYLAWLQCATIFEAWALREAAPKYEVTALRLALGASTARWLLLIITYGTVIPNTQRRGGLVLGTLVLMPLVITTAAALGQPTFGAATAPAALQMAAALVAGGGVALYACVRLNPLPPQALESEMIGQYQLKAPLRAGGMGEVYLAEHVLLKRPCALKLVRPHQTRDPSVRRRFEREARTMAALRHPNAVAVHDSGRTADGTLYYVMEYLPGLSLEELVARDGPLGPGRVVRLLLQLCDAVREAHTLGILHLDIKPGNVLVVGGSGDDVVKLLDFGLARELAPGGVALHSSATEAAGSPQYMAPEQAAGHPALDARADLYGLGGVAYFLLTGRPPFECESALQLVLAHAWDPVTPPHHLRPEVPADLEAVVLCCLGKEPANRFADVADLARALRRCACAGPADAHDGDAPTMMHGIQAGEPPGLSRRG
jgi:serine/threonine-protein kinase